MKVLDQPFGCTLCVQSFANPFILAKHVQAYHLSKADSVISEKIIENNQSFGIDDKEPPQVYQNVQNLDGPTQLSNVKRQKCPKLE